MPNPKNPGERTKAHRLRQAIRHGQKLQPVDQLWLEEYEENDRKRQAHQAGAPDVGASRSARKIQLAIDEQGESVGTGNAAVAGAMAALAAKEEGRRLDSLTLHSIDVLKEAVAVYRDMCLMLRERTEVLEHTHIEMLTSVRQHFIAATQAEGALLQRDAEAKPEDQLLTMLMAKYLGVDPAAVPRPRPGPQKPNGHNPRPPANGAPTK